MISVLFLDCDGILTTGTYLYDNTGKQYKTFSSIDSNGIKDAHDKNIAVEVISSDPTGDDINEARCRDIGIPYHRAIDVEKETVAADRLAALEYSWTDTAAMGDDVTDLEMLRQARVPLTVPNAIDAVKTTVRENGGYVTTRHGGKGAVAEAIRYLLKET